SRRRPGPSGGGAWRSAPGRRRRPSSVPGSASLHVPGLQESPAAGSLPERIVRDNSPSARSPGREFLPARFLDRCGSPRAVPQMILILRAHVFAEKPHPAVANNVSHWNLLRFRLDLRAEPALRRRLAEDFIASRSIMTGNTAAEQRREPPGVALIHQDARCADSASITELVAT